MAIKDKLSKDFLEALEAVESIFFMLSFVKHSFQEKDFTYYLEFKKDTTIVELLFGPPEFQLEMIIYTTKGEFELKDLFEIPVIRKWVNNNRYIQLNDRNIKDELVWFIELMKVSLAEVE